MSDAATADAARVRLGEYAARLDDQLTLLLALHYGREFDHVVALLQEVLWRVSIEERIRLLDEALDRTGLRAVVPYTHPVADRRVWRPQPHRALHPIDETDDALTLFSIRGGKRKTRTLSLDHLRWVVDRAFTCDYTYIPRIEGRIGDPRLWGQLWGFDGSSYLDVVDRS
jgi:hypothetical protein